MRRYFIEEAILNAEKSLLFKANHGAIVVFRGKIVGNGYNKLSINNHNKVNKWSIHAEVDAINDALRKISRYDLKKSILIVVRLKKKGDISLSAPCNDCANYIKKFGILTCYYSDENY
jgi:deoxycytidylate deaminase